jgi:hypothetical protein
MKGSLVSLGLLSFVILAGCNGPTAPAGLSAVPAGAEASANGPTSVPFKGSFEGTQTVTPGTPPFATVAMEGTGTGTQVGRFDIALPHTVNFATSSASGIATIVAADGSRLIASFTGQAQIGAVVTIVEQATVTSGTGRFANVSGSFTIHRTFEPATSSTAGTFEGTLLLGR